MVCIASIVTKFFENHISKILAVPLSIT